MRVAELASMAGARHAHARRFAVSWRNTTTNRIHPVGLLQAYEEDFRFQYLISAATVEGFRPFIGFPRLGEKYQSRHLWPFFALRAMDPRRPDFRDYVGRLGLDRHASVLDILSRSGGETPGDRVSVVEEPRVGEDGSTKYVFLARGMRYATDEFESTHDVDQLRSGDPLRLMHDVGNPVNPDAVLIVTSDGFKIGWVPDLLVGYFRELIDHGASVYVEQNNGPGTSWPSRLLVRAHGSVDPTFRAFAGQGWVTQSS